MNRYLWQKAITHSETLDSSTRLVLLVISIFMDKNGDNAFPSQATIAKRCDLSRQTVNLCIQKAAKLGYVKIGSAGYTSEAWRRNQYYMACPEGCVDVCKTAKCDGLEECQKSDCADVGKCDIACEGSCDTVVGNHDITVVGNHDISKPPLVNHSNTTSEEPITHYVRDSQEPSPSEQSCQAEIVGLSDVEKLSVKLDKPERFPPSVASLPPDWQVMALDGFGLEQGAAEREFAKFRAYWTGNGKKDKSGVARKDWKGTWRNWLKTGAKNKFTGGKNEQKRREIKGETYEQKRDRLRAMRAKGIEVSYQDALWLAAVWQHETHGHPAPAPDAIL